MSTHEFGHHLFKKILSTETPSKAFRVLLFCLSCISYVYARAMIYRVRHKQKNMLKDISAGIISIGNITMGGTGKTPLVAWIANYLLGKNKNVGIILRGYGRKKTFRKPILLGTDFTDKNHIDYFGDEALLLSHLSPHAKIVVSADRTPAIRMLQDDYSCDFILLDDGFQQVHIPKVMDIICMDSLQPLGNGYVFPRGNLREPVEALKRATHYIFCKGQPRKRARNKIKEIVGTNKKIIASSEFRLVGAYDIKHPLNTIEICDIKKMKLLVISSIGNPDSLNNSLAISDIQAEHKIFPDHFAFSQKDINKINLYVSEKKFQAILTTEKDATRLESYEFCIPCYILESELIPPYEFIKQLDSIL